METGSFLETTTLRQILNISGGVMDHAMGVAHQLYRMGRFTEAEVVCKGLIACDHRFGWTYSLYGAVLRNLGRLEEALVQIERGLTYEPAQPKLVLMRNELSHAIARKRVTKRCPTNVDDRPSSPDREPLPNTQRPVRATDSRL